MDLFYRGFDANDRIRSGALHLSAAAARLAMSIVLSIPLLPDAAWIQFKRLLTVEMLWSLCLVIGGWVIATLVGGLVGLAVNGLLFAYGVLELWESLKSVAGSLKQWLTTAYQATTALELNVAARHCAEALSTGGLTFLELVVTHRVFRAVEGKLREAIPAPEWLRTHYEKALRTRDRVMRKMDAEQRLRDRAQRVADSTGAVRGIGAKRAAEGIPGAALAATGALLAMAAVGGLALALSSAEKRARS